MLFEITYDYRTGGAYPQTFTNNLVGREGNEPVGYGPVGPGSYFRAEEVARVVKVLAKQLGTVPTLHLRPVPPDDGR